LNIQNHDIPQDCLEGAYSVDPQVKLYTKNPSGQRPPVEAVYKEAGGEMWVQIGESGPSRRSRTPANVIGKDS